jgi:hypothetical protein
MGRISRTGKKTPYNCEQRFCREMGSAGSEKRKQYCLQFSKIFCCFVDIIRRELVHFVSCVVAEELQVPILSADLFEIRFLGNIAIPGCMAAQMDSHLFCEVGFDIVQRSIEKDDEFPVNLGLTVRRNGIRESLIAFGFIHMIGVDGQRSYLTSRE